MNKTRDVPGETGAEAELALSRLYGFADPEPWPRRVATALIDNDPSYDFPEAWEPHEADPDWDPASGKTWAAEAAHQVAESPPSGEVSDWLSLSQRRYGFVPPGRYGIEILPRDLSAFRTEKTRGISFLVRILGGPEHGTECRLRFLEEGPDAIVRRDLGILSQWGRALGVGRKADMLAYVIGLGRAGQKRGVMLDIGHAVMPGGGIQLFAAAVAVGGERDAA